MKPEFITQELSRCKSVFETAGECSTQAVISLPDYCPEIKRILRPCVHIGNVTVHNNSADLTVKADAVIRLIYIGEGGELSAYEQPCVFEKQLELPENTGCVISADFCMDYVNSRALSPRKVDVKAVMTLKVKASKIRTDSVISSAEVAGVQLQCETYPFFEENCLSEKYFSLSETAEISKDLKPVSRLLNVSSYTAVGEVKTINNKVLLKGNTVVTVQYIPENENTVETTEFTLPLSQIIDADGVNENSVITYRLNTAGLEAIPRIDASGEMRLIDLNLRLQAVLFGCREKSVEIVKDCYSTDCRLLTEMSRIEIPEFSDSFSTEFTNKVVLESIGVSVDNVLGVWCSDLKYKFSQSGDKCYLSGSYYACVIYKDSDSNIEMLQKPIDFDYSVNLKKKAERIKTVGFAQLLGSSCSVTGDSRLELKTEISLEATVIILKTVECVSKATVDENLSAFADGFALTVYYCEKGESLWNIARKYNTTVDCIKAENSIEEDFVPEKRMLLIPFAG